MLYISLDHLPTGFFLSPLQEIAQTTWSREADWY